jgi:hypothetical protein
MGRSQAPHTPFETARAHRGDLVSASIARAALSDASTSSSAASPIPLNACLIVSSHALDRAGVSI